VLHKVSIMAEHLIYEDFLCRMLKPWKLIKPYFIIRSFEP